MNRTRHRVLAAASTMAALGAGLLLASPAAALPPLPVALEDRIRYLCEASSADPEGKRLERRCRAEWRDKVRRIAADRQKVRLVLR